MKKIFLCAVAAAAAFTMTAQNEHIHVFRSDNNITSVKGSEILSITHENGSKETGFQNLVVNTTDGKSTTVSLSVIDSVQVRSTDIPDIYVSLTDYPNYTDLNANWGKDFVYQATLRLDGNGMYDDLPEQHVEFRGRGNSTWNLAKKPYRFKMDSKAKVCGMKKAKTFALIANFIDNSQMRNTTALWVANYLKLPYSNHSIPCNVYINGNYRGLYMLTEKIGIGGGSVDIDEYKGLLFELDSNYDEDYKFMTSFRYNGSYSSLPVMVKDPDLTEICDSLGTTPNAYLAKWQSDFNTMLNALANGSADMDLSQYIDVDKTARYFLVNSLANNHEMKHPKSMYIHKDSIGGVYKFGPVWDFDWAYMFNNYRDETASPEEPLVTNNGDYGGANFCKAIFSKTQFRQAYKQLWDEFVANGFPKLLEYIDSYAQTIEPSAKRNALLWKSDVTSVSSYDYFEFKENVKVLKEWLQKRVDYCNSHTNYGLY